MARMPIGVNPRALVGDMIIGSQEQQKQMQRRQQRPMTPRRMQPDAIRTTVDFRSTPMRKP
jgi:NADPH-dependent ferric siderophore reductase